jgi:hypothetical protein
MARHHCQSKCASTVQRERWAWQPARKVESRSGKRDSARQTYAYTSGLMVIKTRPAFWSARRCDATAVRSREPQNVSATAAKPARYLGRLFSSSLRLSSMSLTLHNLFLHSSATPAREIKLGVHRQGGRCARPTVWAVPEKRGDMLRRTQFQLRREVNCEIFGAAILVTWAQALGFRGHGALRPQVSVQVPGDDLSPNDPATAHIGRHDVFERMPDFWEQCWSLGTMTGHSRL